LQAFRTASLGEAAPAAADLQHALSRFGVQAAQDAPVLGALRGFEEPSSAAR
jgi:hypothetical protein